MIRERWWGMVIFGRASKFVWISGHWIYKSMRVIPVRSAEAIS